VKVVDPTLTGQHEEIESHLLEASVVEQIVDADRLMEHVLLGSDCIDEDALFSIQDDHSMCLDTTIWDLGIEDGSRMSAQEDMATHIGYSVIQREITSSDGMQWHTGVPRSIIDNG
jgi:hypothetical protein